MPFMLKKFDAVVGEKIHLFLLSGAGLSMSESQKSLSRGRVFDANMNVLRNNDTIETTEIYVAMFEGVSQGLQPLFIHPEFALFDKPTGVMVHPISKNTPYSLLDEVRFHFGKNANLVHRIDQETSGLVLIAKNKASEVDLKMLFEHKQYDKKYLAIVQGKMQKEVSVDEPLAREGGMIGVKMAVRDDGKESLTHFKPISYDSVKDQTLIEAMPVTGRQHQIRVHLDHIGHTIIGDPIYGIDEKIADKYLCKELSSEDRIKYTHASRLMLHAYYLGFKFENQRFEFYSKQDFAI